MLEITVAEFRLVARLEEEGAPRTVAAFRRLLPLESKLIQARWSGQSAWIPFGDLDLGIGFEDPTSYPAPGELLIYPGGVSETEILFPYGERASRARPASSRATTSPPWSRGSSTCPRSGSACSGRAPSRSVSPSYRSSDRGAFLQRGHDLAARSRPPLGPRPLWGAETPT